MTNELFDRMTLGDWYPRLFAFCKSVGVSRINVEYSGGGDSGGVDHVEVVFNNASNEKKQAITSLIREELEEELANPIYNRHGSFADGGGYSVSGRVIYDAAGNRAWIEGTDHYYEYHETEDGEEEEETNDEDFDEILWSEDEVVTAERDFSLMRVYLKLNKEPLPTFIHNSITAAAIAGDEGAKECVECLTITN